MIKIEIVRNSNKPIDLYGSYQKGDIGVFVKIEENRFKTEIIYFFNERTGELCKCYIEQMKYLQGDQK